MSMTGQGHGTQMMTMQWTQRVRQALSITVALGALVAMSAHARAQQQDQIAIGLYAPTSPFGGPTQRLEFVTKVANHLSRATGNQSVIGRPYSDSKTFLAAVKKGEIQFAIVDAPFAAARNLPYSILASASRGGSSIGKWIIVAKQPIATLRELQGKRIVAPEIGARNEEFVLNVLLDGEVNEKFFGAIDFAPNPTSAVSMVTLGRADAALVPEAVPLAGGVSTVLQLGSVGWPMLVALPGADPKVTQDFQNAIQSYSQPGLFSRFSSASDGNYQELRGSFGKARKKAIMAEPQAARFVVNDLLEGRTFAIQPTELSSLLAMPLPSEKGEKSDKGDKGEKNDKGDKSQGPTAATSGIKE